MLAGAALAAAGVAGLSAAPVPAVASPAPAGDTVMVKDAFPGCTDRWSANGGVYVKNRACGRPIVVNVYFTSPFVPWFESVCRPISTGGTSFYPAAFGWRYDHIGLVAHC
ncbi:hypothetical protein ILP97_22310 [Amycolatopsis sp. H6(2020)]|nr:hypothetical protein [Amycolatopsis sp. H6(2020)]